MPLRLRRPMLEDEELPPAPPGVAGRFNVPGTRYGPTEAQFLPTTPEQLMTPEQWARAGAREFGAGAGDEFGPSLPLPIEALGSTPVASTAGGTSGVIAPTSAMQVEPPPGPPTEVGPAIPGVGGPPGPPGPPGPRARGVSIGIGRPGDWATPLGSLRLSEMDRLIAAGQLPQSQRNYGREATFANYALGGDRLGSSLFERIMALGSGEERQRALADIMARYGERQEAASRG